MSRLNIRVLTIVFIHWKSIVHQEFVHRGQTVNKDLYNTVLRHLMDAVHRKRLKLWANNSCILHQDNAPISSFLAKHKTPVLPHPPYSPNLRPVDFFYSPHWKPLWKVIVPKTLQGLRRMRRGNFAPSKKTHSKKHSKSERSVDILLLLVEGTTLKRTVCENCVSYLIKLFYSQFGFF